MTKEALFNLINNITTIDNEKLSILESLIDITLEANEKFNLTAIKDKDSFRELMIYDSLLPLKYIKPNKEEFILDIGTGAGFPGLPLAVCNEGKYTLIDSTNKKIRHICAIIDKFNLKNVNAVASRAEEFIADNREKYDYVIARAVAPLNILLELAVPYLKVGGYFVALKGSNAEQELETAKNAIKKLDVEVKSVNFDVLPVSNEKRTIIIFSKKKITNKRYPRKYSEIKNNSL